MLYDHSSFFFSFFWGVGGGGGGAFKTYQEDRGIISKGKIDCCFICLGVYMFSMKIMEAGLND